VSVQILDASGVAIPGFVLADCEPMVAVDELEAPISCAGDLASLAGLPVQLEFYLMNAQLFGFTLA
jgi:hypothetical protein